MSSRDGVRLRGAGRSGAAVDGIGGARVGTTPPLGMTAGHGRKLSRDEGFATRGRLECNSPG